MTFTRIKIDPADKEFSRYIRLRDGECKRCHRKGEGPEGINGLQNSHFYGRGKESTRFDPLNCDSMCAGCHQHFTSNPANYAEWKLKQLGMDKYNALSIRAHRYQKKDRAFELLKAKELVKSLKREAFQPPETFIVANPNLSRTNTIPY